MQTWACSQAIDSERLTKTHETREQFGELSFTSPRSLPTSLFLLEFSALLLIRSDLLLVRWILFQFVHSDRRPRERTESSDFIAICTGTTFIQFCVSSAVCKRGWILPSSHSSSIYSCVVTRAEQMKAKKIFEGVFTFIARLKIAKIKIPFHAKIATKRRINDGNSMAAKVVCASRRDSLKDFSRWKKAKNILVQSRWPRLREFIDFFTFSWCISFLRGNVDAAGFVQQLRNFHFQPAKGWSTEWDEGSFSCLKCYGVFHDAPTLDNLMEKSELQNQIYRKNCSEN